MGRLIGVVTSSRADFGLLRPLMNAIKDEPELDLLIYATGLHYSNEHGRTLNEIIKAGLGDQIVNVECTYSDGSATGTAEAIATGISAFSIIYSKQKPDLIVVMGDRFDMLPGVLAAIPFNIPVAHISGGEITEGVIDDAIRHAVTKLSHLHFPSMTPYAERLIQMGEEPWRIHTVGEPGLDLIINYPTLDKEGFLLEFGFNTDRPISLFTYHPESLYPDKSIHAIRQILNAASQIDTQILFTYPNNDPGSAEILSAIIEYVDQNDNCKIHKSLGRDSFFNALAHCDCIIGNSSSGIVEASSFHLPVVNIGDRQKGRISPANVIHSSGDTAAILKAWNEALSKQFNNYCLNVENPYGDGHSTTKIISCIKSVKLDSNLICKKFISTVH